MRSEQTNGVENGTAGGRMLYAFQLRQQHIQQLFDVQMNFSAAILKRSNQNSQSKLNFDNHIRMEYLQNDAQ